jgi:Tfp pilus assembly protein PilO
MILFQQPVPPVPPIPPMPPLPPEALFVPPWMTLPPHIIVLLTCVMAGAAVIILWPIARALARRLEGRGREDAVVREELDHLRTRVHDLELIAERVGELEERLDFAERLLAQRREAVALPKRGES